MTRITEDIRGAWLVEIDGPAVHCITYMRTRKAADEFVLAIERATRDDARDGRIAGGMCEAA